jgi:prophage regulatory protein
VKTKRKLIAPEDLLGQREIAALSGIEFSKLRTWVHRGKLPEPFVVLSLGPIWLRADVERWIAERAS